MKARPDVYAIFHRYFPGDDALLRLLRARFEAAGLGAEVYPADLSEALHTWQFVPRTLPRHMVHLPRHWDVFAPSDRRQIIDMARGLDRRARGLVLHDRGDWFRRRGELADALGELERRLAERASAPMVFVEYAAGLDLDDFGGLIEDAKPLPHVSACIDTGHVTVFTSRAVLRRLAPEVNPDDPATLDRMPQDRVPAIDEAERQARQALVAFATRLARLRKPLHVHLHDGHLFSRWSIAPVSDHTPIGVDAGPARYGHPLLGENGLTGFLGALLTNLAPGQLSITIEVHPGQGRERRPLGPYAPLFVHWTDLSHAEMTSAWIDRLVAQQDLVHRVCGRLSE